MILISELGIGVLGQFLHMTTCRNASDIKYIEYNIQKGRVVILVARDRAVS